jgi:hypothetical protein
VQDSLEDIACDVQHVRINEASYVALSYEWGASAYNDPTIHIGGHATVVRRNLFHALLHMRRALVVAAQKDTVAVWIDALSINQADTLEKNHQVHLMGSIYRQATHVIIWPGMTRALDKETLAIINDAEPGYRTETNAVRDSVYPVVRELCQKTYWNRVWIQQEVYLAKRVSIMCGRDRLMDFEGFGYATDSMIASGSSLSSAESTKIGKSAAHTLVVRKRIGISLNTLRTWLALACKVGLETSEPRDIIYAMLSVSYDCQNGGLMPDYDKPLLDVYLETVLFCGLHKPQTGYYWLRKRLAEKLGLPWEDDMEQRIDDYCKQQVIMQREEHNRSHAAGSSENRECGSTQALQSRWSGARPHTEGLHAQSWGDYWRSILMS